MPFLTANINSNPASSQHKTTGLKYRSSLLFEVFVIFLSAAAFAIESKRFSLGLCVFEIFTLFHLFNKTSIIEPKVPSFPSSLRESWFCLLSMISNLNSSKPFILGMQSLGHTHIPLNYDKQHFITISNFCDTIRDNTWSNLTLITIG